MAVAYTDFYDAQTARQIAIGQRSGLNDILTEANALQIQIDTSAAAGLLSVTITNATVMTQGAVYYEVWSAPDTYQDSAHKIAKEKMDTIIGYFNRLGYNVKRTRESTQNRIQWTIAW